jgi:hypothetical protein
VAGKDGEQRVGEVWVYFDAKAAGDKDRAGWRTWGGAVSGVRWRHMWSMHGDRPAQAPAALMLIVEWASARLVAGGPYCSFGSARQLAFPIFNDFPILIQMLWLRKYKTSLCRSPKISKLGMVIGYFKMDNFYFGPNYQIPLHFEL